MYEGIIRSNGELRLNGNESPYRIIEDLSIDNLLDNSDFEINRYPDSDSNLLREAYGSYAGVLKNNIIAGNGSDEMLNLIISTYISKGKTLVTIAPDFSMYDFYTETQGGSVEKYKHLSVKKEIVTNRKEKVDKGTWDVEDFILFAKSKKASLIMFSNPNNPTGAIVSNQEIEKILLAFPDINVVVDEAYFEFYGETMVPYINKHKNLIVTRTLSKAWGLAALRVGFLIACEEKIEELNTKKVPYNVNSLSQVIATKALNYEDILKGKINLITKERERLCEILKEVEKAYSIVKFYPSKGNFIYGEILNKEDGLGVLQSNNQEFEENYESMKKQQFIQVLNQRNIDIRSFKNNSFRITVGTYEENERLVEAIVGALDSIDSKK